jgi:dipeptidyl-peptidase III
VSPESLAIFDLILELFRVCKGNWSALLDNCTTEGKEHHLETFIIYAAILLGNLGNYYGYGDKKFFPSVPYKFLRELCSASDKTANLLDACLFGIISSELNALGLPDDYH